MSCVEAIQPYTLQINAATDQYLIDVIVRINLTLILLWWGLFTPCETKFSKKCPCSHNNNTVLIKQVSLIDTALS